MTCWSSSSFNNALLAAAVLLSAASARADDDWLALYPSCAMGPDADRPGAMRILYPRSGIAAVVSGGANLVARVRVASALTPPPGEQQDRALRPWSAALVGEGIPLVEPVQHRYPLRVADVRPDGPSGLVYRVRMHIPAWVAPGTYALRMAAPGGSELVRDAIRVVAPGEQPRIGLAGGTELPNGIAALPVDAWITAAAAPAEPPRESGMPGAAVVRMPRTPHGLAVALRAGRELFVLGRCRDRFLPFDDQLRGIERAESRRSRFVGLPDLPPVGTWRPASEGPDSEPLPLPAANLLGLSREGNTLVLRVAPEAPGPATFTVLVPEDEHATRVDDGTLDAWPATPIVRIGTVPTLALRIGVEPGRTARVQRGRESHWAITIRASDGNPTAGERVTFTATAERPVQRFAWSLEEDETALGTSISHAFRAPGRYEVRVLGTAPDGSGDEATLTVTVAPRSSGCATTGHVPLPQGQWNTLVVWLLVGGIVGRMGRRNRRNRWGSEDR